MLAFYEKKCDMACEMKITDRKQFWSQILVLLPEASFGLRLLSSPASVCLSVCLSVCHEFVRAITHHPFKLESPNLKYRCKRPWLRSLLLMGVIDVDLQGQIQLESLILPHFEPVRTITGHLFKLESPNLDQKCILVWLRFLLIWGWSTLTFKVKFNLKVQIYPILSLSAR